VRVRILTAGFIVRTAAAATVACGGPLGTTAAAAAGLVRSVAALRATCKDVLEQKLGNNAVNLQC